MFVLLSQRRSKISKPLCIFINPRRISSSPTHTKKIKISSWLECLSETLALSVALWTHQARLLHSGQCFPSVHTNVEDDIICEYFGVFQVHLDEHASVDAVNIRRIVVMKSNCELYMRTDSCGINGNRKSTWERGTDIEVFSYELNLCFFLFR